MDQQPPRRRAGDQGGQIRDWQRETWHGPAPVNTNPFEEPDSAPELLEQRSPNVSERSGDFWRENTGYVFGQNTQRGQAVRTEEKPKKRGLSAGLRVVAVLTGITLITVLILYFVVFRVREIRVIGNEGISASDVIRLSGIRYGDSILSLSEDATERKLTTSASAAGAATGNYHYYCLQFRYIDKQLPGTVVISVKEREPCCWLTWCGIMYVMDKSRMVIFESENNELPQDLVEVQGLDIRSGAHAGQTMVLGSSVQESVFEELFREMRIQQCTDRIREVDLSNTANILMETRAGYTVSLGDRDNLHAKLRALFIIQEELQKMGMEGGTISVSSPETPFYSPPSN